MRAERPPIDNELPAYFYTHGEGLACPGDSGGPVYRDDGTAHVIVGVNSHQPANGVSSAHSRLDVESRFDVGSWLASIPGLQISGAPSDHFTSCTDSELLVCGPIARARARAADAFGDPVDLPRWVSTAGGMVWRQEFVKKRVTVDHGAVVVVNRTDAHCEEIHNGTFCGESFGEGPRPIYTCTAGKIVERVDCPTRCGLRMTSTGLDLGCD